MSESVRYFTEQAVKDLPDTLFINGNVFKKKMQWEGPFNTTTYKHKDIPNMVKIEYLNKHNKIATMTYCENGDYLKTLTNQELVGKDLLGIIKEKKDLLGIIKEKRVYQDDDVTNTPETIVLEIARKKHCFYKVMAKAPIEQSGVTFLQKRENKEKSVNHVGWDFFYYRDKDGNALTWNHVKDNKINLYAMYNYETERIDRSCGTTIKHNGKKYTLVAHDNREEFTKHHDHAKNQYVQTQFCCYKGDYKCIAFMEDGKYVTNDNLYKTLLGLCTTKNSTNEEIKTKIENTNKESNKANTLITTNPNVVEQNKPYNSTINTQNIVQFGQTALPHQPPNTNANNYLFANSNYQSQQPKVYPIFPPTVPQYGKYMQNQKILQQANPVQRVVQCQVPVQRPLTVTAGLAQNNSHFVSNVNIYNDGKKGGPQTNPMNGTIPVPKLFTSMLPGNVGGLLLPPNYVVRRPVVGPAVIPKANNFNQRYFSQIPTVTKNQIITPNVVRRVPVPAGRVPVQQVLAQKCYLRDGYYGPCQNTLYNVSNSDKIYGCGQVYPNLGNFTEYMFSNRPIYKCPGGGFITTGKAKYSLTGNPLEYYPLCCIF